MEDFDLLYQESDDEPLIGRIINDLHFLGYSDLSKVHKLVQELKDNDDQMYLDLILIHGL